MAAIKAAARTGRSFQGRRRDSAGGRACRGRRSATPWRGRSGGRPDLGLPVVWSGRLSRWAASAPIGLCLDDLERIAAARLATRRRRHSWPVGAADRRAGPHTYVPAGVGGSGHRSWHRQRARRGADRGESMLGWKEYELELMRDGAGDNAVVVCSIGDLRPDGRPHRRLDHRRPGHDADRPRVPADARPGLAILREVGLATGGCNIQFAINPVTGRIIVIEMNPRVSRSSALASKATGSRSPRSPQSSPSATPWTRSPTTSPRPPRPASSRRWTTSSSRSAVRLREVPGRRGHAHHPHEERRRGDGHRSQLHRGAGQGAAQPGGPEGPVRLGTAGQPGRCRRAAHPGVATARRPAAGGDAGAAGRGHSRAGARGDQDRPLVRRPAGAAARGRRPRSRQPPS